MDRNTPSGESIDQGEISARMNSLLGGRGRQRRIRVIINPISEKGEPALNILNSAFRAAEVDWDVSVTKDLGDAQRFAREAVEAGVDVVAVYGGDGTVSDAASGMLGSQTPLAILPGGTGNVIATELGIPGKLVDACALAANPEARVRLIDMGEINGGQYFLLRASVGFEALMVEGANRELKERFGSFAYTLSGLKYLVNPQIFEYRLNLDGLPVEIPGLTCILANSGAVGAPGIQIAPDIKVDDGLLDVIVVRQADLASLASLVVNVVGGRENPQQLAHWQAKQVTIETEQPQNVQSDGEIIGQTPMAARILPQAMRVVVPH